MAATPRRMIGVILTLAIAVWVWLLAGAILMIRWNAFERPLPPARALFPYGELRIGVDASYPPFAVATADDLFGFEIDLGRALADRFDIPVRFINLGFDGLYDALRTDQVDVLISALPVDRARGDTVLYTQPYFGAGLVLVSDSRRPYAEMSDLPGGALAFEFGAEAEAEARRWLRRVLPFDLRPYETQVYALDAVRLGEADAALVDSVTARLYLRDHADWEAETHPVRHIPYAIAVRGGRYDVHDAISRVLQALIDDGTLDALTGRWF